MPLWTLIVWLIIGAVAGFLARKIMGGTSPGGLLGDLVLGIVGALVGGYGVSLVLPASMQGAIGGLIGTVVVATLGAMLLIWIARQFKKTA